MYEIAWRKIFHEKGDDLSRICQDTRCRNLIMARKNIFGENLYRQGGELNSAEFRDFIVSDKFAANLRRQKHSHNFDVSQSILIKFFMWTYFILRR